MGAIAIKPYICFVLFRKTNIIILTFLLMGELHTHAQSKQANNWYFGIYAGVTFNSPDGSPQPLYDGMINQHEGCASISDDDGNLLFYTDGRTAWNAVHDTMVNGSGLMGNSSSAMSALIVPQPGNDSIYFLFTVPNLIKTIGLRYSIINMNLDNGLGAITDIKNIYLIGPVEERLTSILHGNGHSIWVVTHTWGNNSFYSYLVDEDSLHANPIICNIGINHTNYNGRIAGCMKASMQGNKLCLAVPCSRECQVFDFNNHTALLSNSITFPPLEGEMMPYGVEFAPNASLLYVSYIKSGQKTTKIIQHNLSLPDSASIVNSGIILSPPYPHDRYGSMQLGPDQKIYFAQNFSRHLGCIENPNDTGFSCNLNPEAVLLTPDPSQHHYAQLGLPAFIQSFFNPANFSWEGHCIGDTTFFAITDTASQDSVFWDFGDTITGILNNSTSFFPYHIYSDTGSFQVSVIGYNNSLNDTTLQEVFIHPLPVPFLPADTGFCEGYGVNLWPGDFQSYLWQNGTTDTSFYADTTLSVIVEVTDVQGCKATDSTHAVEHSKPAPVVIYHD